MASARFESSEEVGEQEDSEVDLDQIQRELEKMNSNGDVINALESKLMQARAQHSKDYATFKERLEVMKKRDSGTIAKCEPLVKAKNKMTETQEKLNNAAARYDKANSQHSAAKELIQVAERQLSSSQNVEGVSMDQAWQETLNHATERVVETAVEKSRADQEHKQAADDFAKAHLEYTELWKKLQKSFEKAKPYYSECARYNLELRHQKNAIEELERQIKAAKASYSGALKALDTLNCLIHEKRRATMTSSQSTEHPDYHSSSDKLSFAGEFEASMLSAMPSSSCLLVDTPPPPARHAPLTQEEGVTPFQVGASSDCEGMSRSGSTGSVLGRVAGGLVADAIVAALHSSDTCSKDTCDHPGTLPAPSGHRDNSPAGLPDHRDNSHPHHHHHHPSDHHGVVPKVQTNPLVVVSLSHPSTLKNSTDCTDVSLSPQPPSDQQGDPSLMLGASHQQEAIDVVQLSHAAHSPSGKAEGGSEGGGGGGGGGEGVRTVDGGFV